MIIRNPEMLLAGAAVGAYTQDPFDHSVAAVGGLALGAYVGNNLKVIKAPYIKGRVKTSKFVYDPKSVASEVDISLHSINETLNRRLKGPDLSTLLPEERSRVIESRNNYARRVVDGMNGVLNRSYTHLLDGDGPDALTNLRDNFAKTEPSRKVRQAMTTSMKHMGDGTASFIDGTSTSSASKIASTHLRGQSEEVVRDAIKSHLINNLNTPEDVATREATNLAGAFSAYNLELNDQSLRVTGNGEASTIIPLAKTDKATGVQYRTSGTDVHVVSGANPFIGAKQDGLLFNVAYNGKSSSVIDDEMRKVRFSPAELAAFAHKSGMSITEASKLSHGLLENIGNFDRLNEGRNGFITPGMRQKSALTSFKTTIQQGNKGMTVSSYSSAEDTKNTMALISRLMGQDGNAPFQGVSNNQVGFAKFGSDAEKKAYSIGFATDPSRGSETVLERGHTRVRSHTMKGSVEAKILAEAQKQGLDTVGIENFTVARQNYAGIDSKANAYISQFFGGHVALGDGAGIMSRGFANKMEVDRPITVRLGNVAQDSANPKFISSIDKLGDLFAATSSGDMQRASDIRDAINAAGFKPGSKLGVGATGQDVHMPTFMTDAKLQDVIQDGDGLKLSFSGSFNPGDDSVSWVKGFGNDAKAGYTILDADRFKGMQLMRGVLESGEARITDDGKFQWRNQRFSTLIKKHGGEFSYQGEGTAVGDFFTRLASSAGKDTRELKLQAKLFKHVKKTSGVDVYADVLLRGGDTEISKAFNKIDGINSVEDFDAFKKSFGKDNIVASSLGEIQFDGSKEMSNKLKGVAFAAYATSEGKSNQMAALTLMSSSGFSEKSIAKSVEYSQIFASGDIEAKHSAFKEMASSVSHILDKTGGQLNWATAIAPHLGATITGSGARRSMSWTEQQQLRIAGYTTEMLDKFTTQNDQAIYEADSVRRMLTDKGHALDNFDIDHINDTMTKAMQARPEDRRAILQESFKLDDDAFNGDVFSYKLTREKGGVKSLSVNLLSTNYSGVLEADSVEMLKTVDKAKIEMFTKDIAYRRSTIDGTAGKLNAELYDDSVDRFAHSLGNLFSGDNALHKAATRRFAKVGSDHTARAIGGEALRYAEQNTDLPTAFMSRDGLRASGIKNYKLEEVEGYKHIKKIRIKKNDTLLSQISREPVAGPSSSQIMEILVDTSIKDSAGKNGQAYMYMPEKLIGDTGKAENAVTTMLDFDDDHIRSAFLSMLDNKDHTKFKQIGKQRYALLQEASEYLTQLSAKGTDKRLNSVADLNINGLLKRHAELASKGVERKLYAPQITEFASSLQEAIARSLQAQAGGSAQEDSQLLARGYKAQATAYALIENILKASHKDSAELGAKNIVDELMTSRTDLANGDSMAMHLSKVDASIRSILSNAADKHSAVNAQFEESLSFIKDAIRVHGKDIDADPARMLARQNRGKSESVVERMLNKLGAISSTSISGGQSPLIDSELLTGTLEDTIESSKGRLRQAKNVIMGTIDSNKKLLAIGAAGLGALAMIVGADTPNMSPLAAAPTVRVGQTLPPMKDNKAYITKSQNSKGVSIDARPYDGKRPSQKRMDRSIYGSDRVDRPKVRYQNDRG